MSEPDAVLSIGDVRIGLTSPDPDLTFEFPGAVGRFLSSGPADVRVTIHRRASPRPPGERLLFRSGGAWLLYGSERGRRIELTTPVRGREPFLVAEFDDLWSEGEIFLDPDIFPPGRPAYPLAYPLDEVLVIHRLGLCSGLELHACGIRLPGDRVILLAGASGAGKSTAARLWRTVRPDCVVISDDRVILRPGDGEVRAYGTPWHGDAGESDPGPGRLVAAFFLEQSSHNRVRELPASLATARLLATAFLPFHEERCLARAAAEAAAVTAAVPVRALECTAGAGAVEAVIRAIGSIAA